MKALLSAVFSSISGAGIAYMTVRTGYGAVYAQLTDPFIDGLLWPVSVAGTLLLILIGVIVALAVLMELAGRREPSLLLGRTTYSLVGCAGLLGAAVGAGRVIFNWSAGTGIEPTVEAVFALLIVVVPVMYVFYLLWRPYEDSLGSQVGQGERQLDPEVVRDKTAQWSTDEPRRRQSCTQMRARQSQLHTTGTESQETNSSPQTESTDLTETEFNWTTSTDVAFEDVGGMDEVKTELHRDVVKPLTTHREKAEELGITPTNIIFYGPPGTGKTHVAEALATELDLPFAKLSGADIQSKWINESSQKVNTLFNEARDVAERYDGAVIFLDELDSVLKKRDEAGSAHEEDNKVVNEFLSQLEDTSDHGTVFIGATNRLEVLDSAGIRSGRIDKKIHIGIPDTEARTAILEAQLRDRPHCLTGEQIRAIAKQTDGMTAADLANLVEDAARNSLFDRDDDKITQDDIHKAMID